MDATSIPKGALAPAIATWQPSTYIPGPLTPEEVRQLCVEGYVIKRNLLPLDLIEKARQSVMGLVDTLADKLYAAGKITDKCSDVPFEKRLIEIEKQFPNASVLLHKLGVLPMGVANVWGSDPLLSVAKQLIEGDIVGHPVWNLRTKTPAQEQSVVPWHQDTAYLEPSAVDVFQLTAWVPLVNATKHNGCMEVIKYGHRYGKEVRHECCVGGTWYVQIADGELSKIGADDPNDIVLCEVNQGDVLFLNNIIPHRSLTNVSDHIRWSLDLRWQSAQKSCAFYNLKEPILMVKGDDPSFKVNWEGWAEDDRQIKQLEAAMNNPELAEEIAKAIALEAPTVTGMSATTPSSNASSTVTESSTGTPSVDDPSMDSVIAGPWMGRWNIVHHNKHVDRYISNQAKGVGTDWHSHKGGAFG